MKEELAASYYLDLLRNAPPSWEHQIQRAVREAVRRGECGSLSIIDQLRGGDSPAATEVADGLEVVADFGLARLGLGVPTLDRDRTTGWR